MKQYLYKMTVCFLSPKGKQVVRFSTTASSKEEVASHLTKRFDGCDILSVTELSRMDVKDKVYTTHISPSTLTDPPCFSNTVCLNETLRFNPNPGGQGGLLYNIETGDVFDITIIEKE